MDIKISLTPKLAFLGADVNLTTIQLIPFFFLSFGAEANFSQYTPFEVYSVAVVRHGESSERK